MNIMTLRIAILSESVLTLTLTSLDPRRRIPVPGFNTKPIEGLFETLRRASSEFRDAVRSSDLPRLAMLGHRYAEALLPIALADILGNSSERFLYLDIDEALVSFPWELLRLKDDISINRKFFVGRHQRIAEQRDNQSHTVLTSPLIVSNPDGTMPIASEEGAWLNRLFTAKGARSTLLSTSVTRDEALALIEGASLLHYSGHSTSNALLMSDGELSCEFVEACRKVPFLVFLNSCSPAALEGWNQSTTNLTKSFQKAGAYIVICPITIVENEKASRFARDFYTHFLSGRSVAEAMTSAAMEIDSSGIFSANYVLYGNPMFQAYSTSRSPFTRPKILWASAAVILLSIAAFLSSRFLNSSNSLVFNHFDKPGHEAFLDGIRFDSGDNVPKDSRLALLYYKKAAEQSGASSAAFAALASSLYRNASNFDDLHSALVAYKDAIQKGSKSAELDYRALKKYLEREARIDQLSQNLEAPLELEDMEAAKVLAARLDGPCPNTVYSGLTRSVPSSDLAIKTDVCRMFEPHVLDKTLSVKWLERIGEYDSDLNQVADVGSFVLLAKKYETGDGVAQNSKMAAAWYRKAADAGDPYACSRLGFLFQHGLGVSKDFEEALKWREQAVANSRQNPGLQEIYQKDLDDFKEIMNQSKVR